MTGISGSERLFYGGIVLMAAVVVAAIAAIVLFHVSKKRLRSRLEQEYGKKPH